MTQLHTSRIRTALLAKGFVSHHTDHEYFALKVAGQKFPIRTKISHGQTKIEEQLIRAMAKQLYLTNSEFIDLISCTISGEQYVQLLKERGRI